MKKTITIFLLGVIVFVLGCRDNSKNIKQTTTQKLSNVNTPHPGKKLLETQLMRIRLKTILLVSLLISFNIQHLKKQN